MVIRWPVHRMLKHCQEYYMFLHWLLQANPPQFDRAEDLAHLRYLNESSILHTLRQRYGSNLIHTYAGGSMVIINPMAPLAIHSEKVSFICLKIWFVWNTNINNVYRVIILSHQYCLSLAATIQVCVWVTVGWVIFYTKSEPTENDI